ncbi:MAG TPA: rRNA maturation RNase YbeY [Bryobacteraceae bacterium]|nr:rRNA maturation RNase YbeY [Bryobacteraceae bacterium]
MNAFAARLSDELAGGRPYTCLFTDDQELQRLNRMFLGKDQPTDVLSFPSADESSLGELAISVERARQQADDFGHELAHELRILMLHGVLHLLGHDHESDRGRMARLEKHWRERLDLPAGLIERSRRGKAG